MTTPLQILCVDDEPDIRTIAVMAMELDGRLAVTAAGSGAEALALVEGGLAPDVALLDVMMPGMDGPELFARLRERADFADVPVIFMTAKARTDDITRYRDLGAIGVVVKPFDPLNLADEIRSLLGVQA